MEERGGKCGSADKARWGAPLEGPLLGMERVQVLGFLLANGDWQGREERSHRTVIHRRTGLHREGSTGTLAACPPLQFRLGLTLAGL